MKKNTILVLVGAADFFCSPARAKFQKPEEFLKTLGTLVEKDVYKGIVNLTIPNDTNKTVNLLKDLRPQRVIDMTLFADNLLHINNEISMKDLDGDAKLFDGNQFDYLFPAQDYDIHFCGVDVNGIFNTGIKELLELGYNVALYSDAIKPFKNTYKNISTLVKNPNFQYCSFKIV